MTPHPSWLRTGSWSTPGKTQADLCRRLRSVCAESQDSSLVFLVTASFPWKTPERPVDPETLGGGRGEQKCKAEESIQSCGSPPSPPSLQIRDLFLQRRSSPQYNRSMHWLWGPLGAPHLILNKVKQSTSLNHPPRFLWRILKYAQKKRITRYSKKAPKMKRRAQNK